MKHVWFGLDPGITTGWAALSDDGKVIGSGDLDTEFLRTELDALIRGFHRTGHAINVVIERMPRVGGTGRLGRRLDDVWKDIYEIIEQTYELPVQLIPPGEWKPSRVARHTRIRGISSVHQKDAIKMTMYAMSRREG